MKSKNLLTAAAAMLLMAGAAQAQTNSWTSYSYVEAQGGVQLTSTNARPSLVPVCMSTHGRQRVVSTLLTSITNGNILRPIWI